MEGAVTQVIYICVGSTGEYSDHIEWYVRAFRNEKKCRDFVEAVSAEYRRIAARLNAERRRTLFKDRGMVDMRNPLDPDMQVDYTGTNYSMVTVPFDEE